MKLTALALGLACAACGGLDATNDQLAGTWSTGSSGPEMLLVPGKDGVFGAVVGPGGQTFEVVTLPHALRWIDGQGTAWDFALRIAPPCPGEPHPVAGQIHEIDLDGPNPFLPPGFDQGPSEPTFRFTRAGEQPPNCPTGRPNPGIFHGP